MDNGHKRFIESEMDRFEKEISSIAPPSKPLMVPAQFQVRKPMGGAVRPGGPPQLLGGPFGGKFVPPPPPARLMKPSPVIISGAPQVYNAGSSFTPSSTSTITSASSAADSMASFPLSKDAMSSGGGGSFGGKLAAPGQSVTPTIKPLDTLTKSTSATADKKKKKKKKKKDDKDKKPKKNLRSAGGQVWEDRTLADWDPSDFRLFCGDLGNDVTDEVLTRVFSRYPSFQRARVIRDNRSNKTKGFGFVSFKDPADFSRAVRELDGRYVGSRPIKLRKSNWRARNIDEARKKEKERQQIMTLLKK